MRHSGLPKALPESPRRYDVTVQIRPLTTADVDLLRDIDATMEITRYLHVDQSGEGLRMGWRMDERPMREKRTESNALTEDTLFLARQIAGGIEDGLGLVTEYDDQLVALALAMPDVDRQVLRLMDVRVDFDFRRQGMGTALGYMVMQHARDKELRAVMAETLTDNVLAASFLLKAGFKPAGVDTLRQTNHDLVKERATVLWYATIEK